MAGELHALPILGVAADAFASCALELRGLAAMAPEALHALLGARQAAIRGGQRVRAGQLPPRVLDADAMPRAL